MKYEDSSFLVIQNDTELAAISSAGGGTESDPYIISNLRIRSPSPAIRIYQTTAWFVIRDCYLSTTSASYEAVVQFSYLENGAIEDCYLSGATNGVQIAWSNHSRVSNCYSLDNVGNGVYTYQSSHCNITGCHIYANNKGIMFEAASHCRVEDNDIYRNTYVGVEFAPYCHNNTVVGNRFGWNFVRNGRETQGRDSGLDNSFDDGVSTGNTYTDYNASEEYLIAGDAGNIDRFASGFSDDEVPTIGSLPDFAFDINTRINFASWAASDSLPFTYAVYLNSQGWVTGVWDGREIEVFLDTLPAGTHNLTIVINDGAMNNVTDTVFVTAVSFVFSGMGTHLVMIASGITVLSFILLLALIRRLY